MMVTFFGLNFVFKQPPNVWMDVGLLFVFYGLYYGVMGRDISEICADKMASHVGVSLNNKFKLQNDLKINFKILVLHKSRYANTDVREKCLCRLWKSITNSCK